jgi:hypothetical protein
MPHSVVEQPQVAARSRTNAALVFAFHANLRRVPARSEPPLRSKRRPVLADLEDEPGWQPSGSLAQAIQVAKWIAMLAAIAAPWVLLLT